MVFGEVGAGRPALDRVAPRGGGRILATLIRHVGGDFALAEDALQDAYAVAATTWPRDGAPRKPGAWITDAARRRAIDRLRRARAADDRIRSRPRRPPPRAAAGDDDTSPRRRRTARCTTTGCGSCSPAATRRWPWRRASR